MKSKRARADQYARRVNAAGRLLDSGLEVSQATRRIAQRYGLSDRQARRYVEHARDEGEVEVEVEVPKAKIVFTVKLPAGLAQRVRAFARASGRTVSALVAQALHEYLDRERAGTRGDSYAPRDGI